MASLSAYPGVENTALTVLRSKGYQVWKNHGRFMAEKNGWDFAAHELMELLGIVSIFEYHRPVRYCEYWWIINDPYLLKSLPDTPKPYVPVWKRTNN